jgi:hypothetical protein
MKEFSFITFARFFFVGELALTTSHINKITVTIIIKFMS